MSLPAEEARHSGRLLRQIRARIADRGGWISFEEFMQLALYAPGLGYYSAGSVKLGAAGDFVTAPEMGELFGRCLAAQCAELLERSGGVILELGAGTGRLAHTVLSALAAAGSLPERYEILEVSADLAARQRERLASLPAVLRERVIWLDRLPERPLRGIVLANEVLDALPCRRFRIHRGQLRELGVAADTDGRLTEQAADPDERLARAGLAILRQLGAPLPEGYTSELSLTLKPWIGSLSDRLEEGVILLADYGMPRAHYYHPQRYQGTLRCHYRQRASDDPFARVGLQDITAWVDFTAVAEAAVDCGLAVLGFTTQAGFLLGTGIERLVASAEGAVERARSAGEARRLLMPGEMGEACKVVALGRGVTGPLGGFVIQDLRRQL